MTSPFTCITCRVAFKDLEIQRQHYKSDWHRYNLKRKVAELPSVTVEDFQKKVIAQRNVNDQAADSVSCKICRKSFNTIQQYDNHLVSKKHKEKSLQHEQKLSSDVEDTEDTDVTDSFESIGSIISKDMCNITNLNQSGKKGTEDMEVDSDIESVDSDEWLKVEENPVENNGCLFCSHHSKSWVRNLKHMTVAHSFFIPDPEYCVDIRGLLIYLGEKVFEEYMCIWCDNTGKAFHSADAARSHMIDKGHCKMLHEGDVLLEYADFYDYSSSYPDADVEDPDAEIEISQLEDNDYQLVLPSGNVIGHRSLMRYYKQSLNPNRAVAITKSNKLHKILSQYRALGWTDTKPEVAAKKARDIKYMQRIQTKYSTQLQFKANKLQKHFRPQVNF